MLLEVGTSAFGTWPASAAQDRVLVRVRLPLSHDIAERILEVVLARLGVASHLVPGFRAMYVGYWAIIIQGLDRGAELRAAIANAKQRRDRMVIITIGVGAPLQKAVKDYLATLDRKPPQPELRNPSDGGSSTKTTGSDLGVAGDGRRSSVTSRTVPAATDLFGRVYEVAQSQLKQLVSALEQVLYAFGCGDSSPKGRQTFETEFRRVLQRIYGGGVPGVRVQGSADGKAALVRALVLGFGGSDQHVRSVSQAAAKMTPAALAEQDPTLPMHGGDAPSWVVDVHIDALHTSGVELRRRLVSLMADLSAPYRRAGGASQACTLLAQFPDIATTVYGAAGLVGLASFPPAVVGPLNDDAATFKQAAEHWSASANRWAWFKIGGLIVAGIAITAISAGTLGPLGATLVGTGIGLATGALDVYSAHTNLRFQMDAVAFGGASPERIELAQGQIQGAFAGLLVNVVTMGAMARFGGNAATPALSRMVRVTTLSGAGGGLSVAVQPDVWTQPNVGGLILWGTLLGAGLGAGGTGIGLVGQRLLRAGAPVQIAIVRGQGPPRAGKTVLVQLSPTDKPVRAVVSSVSNDTLALTVQGTQLRVRIAKAAKIESNLFDPKLQREAIRPLRTDDLSRRRVPAYVDRRGTLRRGTVTQRSDGKLDFVDEAGIKSVEEPDAVRVYDASKHAKVAGVAPEDLEAFRSVADRFTVHKAPKTRGVFLAIPKTKDGRLALVVGPSRDHNGAFGTWSKQGTPKIDMRGQGRVPDPDEIALLGAHGNPFGFSGISTRKAGRLLADTIVTLNELQIGRRGPMRAVELSSCQQGKRRFLLVGKTNAEAMQAHVNRRLAELGYAGQHRITVVAADRMGNLYGVDKVKVDGKKVRTTFVPAGQQRPLAYQADFARARLQLMGVVLGAAAAGTVGTGGGIVGAKAMADPDGMRGWIRRHANRIIGWIFDGEDR